MSCLSESFLSEIPEKASESFLSEVFLPKVFRPKVFDFNVQKYISEPNIKISQQQASDSPLVFANKSKDPSKVCCANLLPV